MYLSVTDIANPDLFVCGSRTWICLDIAGFYEEYCQPSSGSAWLACLKTEIGPPLLGREGSTQFVQGLRDRCDSSIACRLCRLEPGGGLITLIRDNITFTTTYILSTINTHNTELQIVKVHINNTKHITIANIYIPHLSSTSTHYKTADTKLGWLQVKGPCNKHS